MKAILVDDEQLALDYLEHQLGKVGGIEILGKYNNPTFYYDHDDLLDAIDVVFLDIDMPDINGLELAEQLLETHPSLSIVFVTGHNKYAVDAFSLHVLDYVMKPVQVDCLRQTVMRIKALKRQSDEDIHIGDTFLHINVCNELEFRTPEGPYGNLRWRTSKSHELFLYLLQHSDRTIRKAELIELFWPDFDEEKAFPQLYTTIYHIRKIIRPFRQYIGIHNNRDGYRLWTHNIVLDIALWESRVQAASPITIEKIQEFEKHMEKYTGPYLGSHAYEWAESERHRLEQLWIQTAYNMAKTYEDDGQLENAVKWYVKDCTVRPEDEDSQFALMKNYAQLGMGMLVHHQYKQLEQALEELGVAISVDISEWYADWKRT